jgi:NitT/TauT family transport system permease protein
MPSPTEIATKLWALLQDSQYTDAIVATMGNIAVATVLASLGGFFLAIVLHANSFLRRGIEPFLASYYAVPTFIFYPVLIVIFGVGNVPIICIAVLMSIVAMITATLTGLDRLAPVYRRTAKVMQMSALSTAVLITLPAIAPYLFTGLRLVISYSFIGVIASEFILSGQGLGYAIAYAYNNFQTSTMYALIAFVVIIVSILNLVLNRIDERIKSRMTNGA